MYYVIDKEFQLHNNKPKEFNMKVNAEQFADRVAIVVFNIIGFYYVNPTKHRYDRLNKIIDKLDKINDTLEDNKFHYENWLELSTVKHVLFNLGSITWDASAKNVDIDSSKNRKVTVECGTLCLHLNDRIKV